MKRLLTFLVLAILLTSCSYENLLGPNLRQIPITPEMEQWWLELEACSGLKGDIHNVKFYVSSDSVIIVNGKPAGGAWYSSTNSIVLVERLVHKEFAMKHEMMHALLQAPGHPHEYFDADRGCGNLWWEAAA